MWEDIWKVGLGLKRRMVRVAFELAYVLETSGAEGMKSFWKKHLSGTLPFPFALKLALAARTLMPLKIKIAELSARGLFGPLLLIQLARMIEHGHTSLDWINTWLNSGEPEKLDRELKRSRRLWRKGWKGHFRCWIRIERDLFERFRQGALLAAVRQGYPTLDEAVVQHFLKEEANKELPDEVKPYRELVLKNAYYCQRCGEIPLHPKVTSWQTRTVVQCKTCRNEEVKGLIH